MRRVSLLAAALLAAAAAPALAADRAPGREDAVALALDRNPELVALRAEVAAAREAAGLTDRLLRYNPTLGAAAGPRRGAAGSSADLSLELGVPLEPFGQQGHRVEAADTLAAELSARLAAREAAVAADVRGAWAASAAAVARARLATEARSLAGESLRAAEERQRAGETSRLEVNSARVELGRSIRDAALAGQARALSGSDLALLLGATEVPEPEGATPADRAPSLEELLAAVPGHPDVVEAERAVVAARAASDLSRAEAIPPVTVGAAVSREEAATVVLGTLSLPLPLFDRNQPARAEASGRVARAEALLAATRRRVEVGVRRAHGRQAAALVAADAFGGDAVAALGENLSLATEAYRAGKLDFLQLLVVRRETLEGRRAAIDAAEELGKADADVGRALGRTR